MNRILDSANHPFRALVSALLRIRSHPILVEVVSGEDASNISYLVYRIYNLVYSILAPARKFR
jgi:hypothetical protein